MSSSWLVTKTLPAWVFILSWMLLQSSSSTCITTRKRRSTNNAWHCHPWPFSDGADTAVTCIHELLKLKTWHLYRSFLWELTSIAPRIAHVNEASHGFTCHLHILSINGIMEWTIMRLLPRRSASLHFGWYSFKILQRLELAWVAYYIPRWSSYMKTVGHSSTNRPIVQWPGIELIHVCAYVNDLIATTKDVKRNFKTWLHAVFSYAI